ncbi:hypothetical protein [Ponticoccus litoralis]|uniref:Uncharacterized protein n=1 Tax=Ponticoccus litoralis TaxID=422297 RepID=A0AAW9SPM2_9RHOB
MLVSRIALLAGIAAVSTTTLTTRALAQDGTGFGLGTLVLEAESDDTLLQNGYVAESVARRRAPTRRSATFPRTSAR